MGRHTYTHILAFTPPYPYPQQKHKRLRVSLCSRNPPTHDARVAIAAEVYRPVRPPPELADDAVLVNDDRSIVELALHHLGGLSEARPPQRVRRRARGASGMGGCQAPGLPGRGAPSAPAPCPSASAVPHCPPGHGILATATGAAAGRAHAGLGTVQPLMVSAATLREKATRTDRVLSVQRFLACPCFFPWGPWETEAAPPAARKPWSDMCDLTASVSPRGDSFSNRTVTYSTTYDSMTQPQKTHLGI